LITSTETAAKGKTKYKHRYQVKPSVQLLTPGEFKDIQITFNGSSSNGDYRRPCQFRVETIIANEFQVADERLLTVGRTVEAWKDLPTDKIRVQRVTVKDSSNVMKSIIFGTTGGSERRLEVGMSDPLLLVKQKLIDSGFPDGRVRFPEQLQLAVDDVVLNDDDCNLPIKDDTRVTVVVASCKIVEVIGSCSPKEQELWAAPYLRYSKREKTRYAEELGGYFAVLKELKRRCDWNVVATDYEKKRIDEMRIARLNIEQLKEQLRQFAGKVHRWMYTNDRNAWTYTELRAWEDDDTRASYFEACDDYVETHVTIRQGRDYLNHKQDWGRLD